MPDGLVFAAAIPRLFGARVLLDLHECMPEFFATKYGVGMDHPGVRIVSAIEQVSIRFSDRVITGTDRCARHSCRAARPQRRSTSCLMRRMKNSSTLGATRRGADDPVASG
jgi:hypothetical protein